MWPKIKAWFKHSATIAWARLVALSGVLLAAAENLIADPSLNTAIQAALSPKLLPFWIILFGILTEIFRRRTAGKT